MPDHAPEPPARPVPAVGDGDGDAHRAMMGMMGGPERSPFGTALRHARLAAGLSQERLAERAGLSARTLSDLERGVTTQPRLETVQLLATALALSEGERAALLAAARPAPPWTPQTPPAVAAALTPLIGRRSERALLECFLSGAGDAEPFPPLLLLAGEPGLGKTRLLQAAAQQAIAQGWTVLEGGCYRRGGQEPYAPLLDALAHHLHLQQTARLGAELAGCAWLGRLLPELAPVLEPLPTVTLAPEQEQRLVYAAVARLLANVSGPAGTLLVLDDLQWAGPDALDLLAALLRRPELHARAGGAGRARLRVVAAYRDTEVRSADPLGHLRADLAQAGLVRHHALGPLAPAEAAELLSGLLGGGAGAGGGEGATGDLVLERAGGVPFYLVSYAQALRAAGAEAGVAANAHVEAVPWDVAQGVRQRVALLPEAARELLGVAAVVGRRVPWALLVASCGQGEDTVLAGLEAAGRARLLVEAGDDVYAFAHDVIREVVEADLSAARRTLLHRRVAAALEGDPVSASADLLAYHYARGGLREQALRYLEQAGDHAWAQRAHGAAVRQYRETLGQLERLDRPRDAVRMREKLAEVLKGTGRYSAALEALEPAAETYSATGDLEGLARILARILEVHALRGTVDEGMARLQPLLEQVTASGGSPWLAPLYLWLAMLPYAAGRYEEALVNGERAAELAHAGGDDRTLMQALWIRANLLQLLGRLDEALQTGREVLSSAEVVGDLECLVSVPRDMAYIHGLQGAYAAGRRCIDQSVVLAEQMENPAQVSFSLAIRGWLATLEGDWQRAHDDLDRAEAASHQVDRSWHLKYLPIVRARLSLAEGAWAAATASVQEALVLVEGSGDLQALRWASGIMAEIDMVEGRPEAARARLLPLLDRPGLEECDVTLLLPVLAWAQLELGQDDLAATIVEQALARARPEEMRLVLVEALRVRALVALRQGQWNEAAGSLEEGLELARAMPYPYAEARLLHGSAQLHHQQGELETAHARLEAALAIFRRLGAGQDTAQAEQTLASLSQNPPLSQNPAPSQNGSRATFEPQVTEARWACIAAILPSRAPTGRPRADDRLVLEAILYKQRTGCAWAALPAVLGDGATAHRRWRQWQEAGLWHRIAAIIQAPPAPAERRPGATGAPPLGHDQPDGLNWRDAD